jgi:uncharacterized protein (DUF1501 family)
MKRRDFLKQGLKLGIAANALPLMVGGLPISVLGRSPLRSALQSQSANNNNVLVVIQLQGGNDGLNTVIPYQNPLYDPTSKTTLRPTLGISASALTNTILKDHNSLAFHPSLAANGGMSGSTQLPSFYDLYSAGKMAILQNVGYPNPILSHFRGTDVWQTSTDSNIYASTGWVGRWLLDENPGYPPATIAKDSWPLAIQIGSSLSNVFLSQAGGVGIAITQLPTKDNVSAHTYDALLANPVNPYHELGYVRSIQSESEVYTQTLVDKVVGISNKIAYPTGNTLATQLSYVAKCILASGGATKVYLVTIGSFDTHSNQLTGQANLLSELSAAVGAFQTDIEQMGVANNVAIMTYSEFGRRPQENGSGTDHGTAAPHFVISTQVNPGVYGTDPNLTNLTAGNLNFGVNHDFRNMYTTMLNEWLLAGGSNNMTEIGNVLTSSNGVTYSTNADWVSLGLFQPQAVGTQPDGPGLMMLQNYPNPFTTKTVIEYTLPSTAEVQLSVFNIAGEEVARIVDGTQSPGNHRAEFNAGNLPSGMYIYRLTTGGAQITQQMMIVK